jgi:hypothetical protein
MDVKTLFSCLTDKEKADLYLELLEVMTPEMMRRMMAAAAGGKVTPPGTPIEDWIEANDDKMTARLAGIMKRIKFYYKEFKLIEQLTPLQFVKMQGAGAKTLKEYKQLRGL